jgi:hypothetical protein
MHDLTIDYVKTAAEMAVVGERLAPTLVRKRENKGKSRVSKSYG